MLLGLHLLGQDNAKALKFFLRAEEIIPDDLLVKLSIGYAFNNLGRYAEEVGVLKRALAIDARYLKGRINLALAYTRLYRFKDAVEMCNETLKIYPKSAQIYAALGICKWWQCEFSAAADYFRHSLALEPLDWVKDNLLFTTLPLPHRISTPCTSNWVPKWTP